MDVDMQQENGPEPSCSDRVPRARTLSSLNTLFEPDKPSPEQNQATPDDLSSLPLETVKELLNNALMQGNGEALWSLGNSDPPGLPPDVLEKSLEVLRSAATALEANCSLLRTKTCGERIAADCLIRTKLQDVDDFLEVRVAVLGNVDAGKSTLLGVLTHGLLDDGRGLARMRLFRHKHEMESGRTSSVGNDILGFDGEGHVLHQGATDGHAQPDWAEVCRRAAKVVTFIDLAGHERYLKTTVFGMTGHAPDVCMLMVGANAGLVGMTKEHLGLALALHVPVFVVVTKIDMCPQNVLQDTLRLLQKLLRSPGCRKMPLLVQNTDDVVTAAMNFHSQRLCPVFQVSNVSGQNLDLLKQFLNLLRTRMEAMESEPAEFQMDDLYSVPGVGTVVSGTVLRGVIRLNDTLLLGPDALGKFRPVQIKGIHRKRLPVKECHGGQTASFAIKKIRRAELRKGMVLLSPLLQPDDSCCWEFEADILVLHHPTTISVKYQAMVHIGPIRQTCTIVSMNTEHLRTGDKAAVRFQFIKNPEYLRTGMRMVFREGRTKAVGTVTRLYPQTTGNPTNTKCKVAKMQTQRGPRETTKGPGRRGGGRRGRKKKRDPDEKPLPDAPMQT